MSQIKHLILCRLEFGVLFQDFVDLSVSFIHNDSQSYQDLNWGLTGLFCVSRLIQLVLLHFDWTF